MNKDRFKFRVWDKYTHETPAEQIQFLCINGCLVDSDGCHHSPDDYIVEQCTGLKDKNGNLIYEGDIVGFCVYGQDEEWHTQQGTVIWYNSCWGIETSSRFIQFENELTIKDPKDIEIIGNIHEQKDNE